jgi:hypothetical protein
VQIMQQSYLLAAPRAASAPAGRVERGHRHDTHPRRGKVRHASASLCWRR